MKFGVQIQPVLPYTQFKEIWLQCEQLGFDSVWAYDHLSNCLEGWTLISALAELTRNIRFGLLVTCNSYRNPSLLAKAASTLDIISEGRLDFAIGAGDDPEEYEAYGYDYSKNSASIDR